MTTESTRIPGTLRLRLSVIRDSDRRFTQQPWNPTQELLRREPLPLRSPAFRELLAVARG
jgi:hypothetical protein